ncbi:MAG: hypothetical protein ISQ34_02060 [Rickettsiales bacterium]|nr:hypothetical protein [Rickettsiales bacterium]
MEDKILVVKNAFLQLAQNNEELISLITSVFANIRAQYSADELLQVVEQNVAPQLNNLVNNVFINPVENVNFTPPILDRTAHQYARHINAQQIAHANAFLLSEVRRSYHEMVLNPRYFMQRPYEALGRLSCMGFVATWAVLNDYVPANVDDSELFTVNNYSVGVGDVAVNLMLLGGLYCAANNSFAAITEALATAGGMLTYNHAQQTQEPISRIWGNRLVFPVAITLAMMSVFYDSSEDLNFVESIFSTIGVGLAGAGATRFVTHTAGPIANRIAASLQSLNYEVGLASSRASREVGSMYESFSSLIGAFGNAIHQRENADRRVIPIDYDVELGENENRQNLNRDTLASDEAIGNREEVPANTPQTTRSGNSGDINFSNIFPRGDNQNEI